MLSRVVPLLALAFAGGCRFGDEPLSAWVANDMVGLTDRTRPFDDPSVYDAARKTIGLFGAANETVSCQIVVDGGPDGARGLEITWSDLVGPQRAVIPAGQVRIFRMLPIQVSHYPPWYLRLVEAVPEPAGFYDPLVPIDAPTGGQPFALKPNERLALWVDLPVPRGAAGGRYSGTIRIVDKPASRFLPGNRFLPGGREWTARLELEVYSFVLPDSRPVPAIGGFDHGELLAALLRRDGRPFRPTYLDRGSPDVRRGLAIMRDLITLAHDHRLDVFDKQIRPLMKRDAEGRIRLEWADYDAIVTPYLKGTAFADRVGCAAWPMPFDEDWPKSGYYGGASTPAYAQAAGELLGEVRGHLAKLLGANEQMFHWPVRQGPSGEAYDLYARLAGIIRQADPNTPVLSQLPPDPPSRTGWTAPAGFAALVDILAPPCDYLDPAAASGAVRAEHRLKGVWLAPGSVPYLPSLGLIATPGDVRAVPWFAMKYQCTGLFLPEVLHWSAEPFSAVAGAETRLFYPGTIAGIQGPLPSVRLKRLRRGLQDIAQIWILQQRQRPGVARTLTGALVRYAGLAAVGDNYLDPRLDGWVTEGQTWLLARRLLAEEVQAVVHPELAARTRTLAHELAWKQFQERTRGLKVEQVRSFVTPAPGATGDPPESVQVTALLDLYNRYGDDVQVGAEFVELPTGFRAVETRPAEAMPAGSRKVLRLAALGPGPLPTDPSAKVPLQVRLTTSVGEPVTVAAAVPFLVVARAAGPLKIDGHLDDWPPRVGNTAGGFKLLGRRGEAGDGLARRQTSVFVLRDESRLYLAFRCQEPAPAGMRALTSNRVHYEQLMACGEDLVEVLLDPGASAAGPEGLYHVVVKPNGVLICERGVGSDPPLGRVEPWASAATVAVASDKGGWVVELAIPLESFGEKGRSSFWRANFTRYATQGAEASSWSGAPRYFYDPRNLGTMFVGPVPKTDN